MAKMNRKNQFWMKGLPKTRFINKAKGIASLAICAALCLCMLPGCQKEEEEADFSGIKSVCELATLQCYYHNVAKANVQESGILRWVFRHGYKRLWIEYSGIVNVGIDMNEVEISVNNLTRTVSVHIPEAKILSTELDKESISKPLVETGFLTHITANEKTQAMAAAEDSMHQTASENKAILNSAYQRAKDLIEDYVKNAAALVGQEYKVEWT